MSALLRPTVHMNGTSRAELTEQLCDAMSAIRDAIKAVQNAAPNGRDYYPQGPQAIGIATGQHTERLDKLRAVYRELNELCEGVQS